MEQKKLQCGAAFSDYKVGQNNYKVGQLKNYKVGQKNHKEGQKNHKVGQLFRLQSGAAPKLQSGAKKSQSAAGITKWGITTFIF